ncbi:MAG: RNA polymerase sigma factor [Eubacteriales bacterium]|nr:RNA polymerase sigma factor [Eubacteriales bacterium]
MGVNSFCRKVQIDDDLFDQIQHGDKDAFRVLYEESYKPLYAFLVSLTQNSEDAQDLLQETYITISQRCHLYTKQGNPMAWMMRIAKNLFLMELRKKKVEYIEDYDQYDFESKIDLSEISSVENRIVVEQLFKILSAEEQTIVIMHVEGGLKYKEIADVLEKPLGTVLAKYNRAIGKMRKALKE